MVRFLALGITLLTAPAFALPFLSDARLVQLCRSVGVEKVIDQAQAMGVEVRASQVKVCDIDNDPLNPMASYVWFCVPTEDATQSNFQQLVQKPAFGKCF